MKLYPTGSITVNHSKYLQKKLQFYLGIGELRRQMKTMILIDMRAKTIIIPKDMRAKTTIIPRNMRAKTTIDDNNTKG